MKRASKAIALMLIAVLSFPSLSSAQVPIPVAFDSVFFQQVDEGSEAFCSLSSADAPIPRGPKIQASASLTVTAVSGTPFDIVSVGDRLDVKNSDGVSYRLVVAARASSTSITAAGLDSAGAVLTSLTLTNASFTFRKVSCGTAIDDGVIDVSRIRNKVIHVFVSQSSLTSGNLQARVLCRTLPGTPWYQIDPVLAKPSVTPTYYGYATTVLGNFTTEISAGYGQCRVGFSLSGTDTGAADFVSVSVSGIS